MHSPLVHFGISAALRIGILQLELQTSPGTRAKKNSLLSYRLRPSVSSARGRKRIFYQRLFDDNRPRDTAWLGLTRSIPV